MILTAQRIMGAARALPALTNATLPYRFARQVNRLNQWIRQESESITKAQVNLVEKYKGVVHPDGSITFESTEAQDNFVQELSKQFQEEIDYDIPVCNLSGGCDDLSISAADIAALDGLVIFD